MNQETFDKEGSKAFNEKTADDLSKKIGGEAVLLGKAAMEDPRAQLREEQLLMEGKQQQELRKMTAEADKMVQDNEGRRKFSWAIFRVMVVWIFMVLLIVIACAAGWWSLSDSVLIALITTTTATVIGVFVVVANYLFNRDKST